MKKAETTSFAFSTNKSNIGMVNVPDPRLTELEKHQKTRINVLIGKETDIRAAGYNVHQSKIAIICYKSFFSMKKMNIFVTQLINKT